MASVKPFRNPSGETVYRVQWRENGKPKQETFRDPGAEKAAHEFAALIEKFGAQAARDALERRRGNTSHAPTLREWVDTYLDPASGILSGIEDGTRAGYRSIANHFLPRLGDLPVDAITKEDVTAWVTWQERQPARYGSGVIAAKTVKNYHGLLSNVFAAAVEKGLRPDNPARRVRLTTGTPREAVFLSPDQFMRLLEKIPDRHKPLVVLLAATGARWGEATALTWGDINVHTSPPTIRINKAWKKADHGAFKIGPTKTKAGRRTVAVEPAVVARLGERGEPGELVFRSPKSGSQVRYSYFREHVWVPAVERANLGVTPRVHDLRHTHASWQIARGVPLSFLRVRLGHEKINTTDSVYGHLMPDAHTQMVGTVAFLDTPPMLEA